jgi:methyl-accepting chemotaxis protein
VTQAYNQGLQTGQALRNILLEPSNTKADNNFLQARKAFSETFPRIAAIAPPLDGGRGQALDSAARRRR